jgi:hypothetical protein
MGASGLLVAPLSLARFCFLLFWHPNSATLMTVEHIRELLHKNSPLTVHLMSGRKFFIPQSDFAHISQSQNYLVFTNEDDTVELIRLPSIESITVEKAPAA